MFGVCYQNPSSALCIIVFFRVDLYRLVWCFIHQTCACSLAKTSHLLLVSEIRFTCFFVAPGSNDTVQRCARDACYPPVDITTGFRPLASCARCRHRICLGRQTRMYVRLSSSPFCAHRAQPHEAITPHAIATRGSPTSESATSDHAIKRSYHQPQQRI